MFTLVRRWTHLCTSGLPRDSRDRRRAEIESELWEAERAATSSLIVLARLVLGMPADVAWRVEVAHVTPSAYAAALALLAAVITAGWWLTAALDPGELPAPAGPRMRFIAAPPPPPADTRTAEKG
jgi:hypothetical protein